MQERIWDMLKIQRLGNFDSAFAFHNIPIYVDPHEDSWTWQEDLNGLSQQNYLFVIVERSSIPQ